MYLLGVYGLLRKKSCSLCISMEDKAWPLHRRKREFYQHGRYLRLGRIITKYSRFIPDDVSLSRQYSRTILDHSLAKMPGRHIPRTAFSRFTQYHKIIVTAPFKYCQLFSKLGTVRGKHSRKVYLSRGGTRRPSRGWICQRKRQHD